MKNKSSWILLLVSLLFLFGVIYYNNHQADFSVKKAHRCFKKNDIACTQNNLEKAFKLGVNSKPERELYLNTIITSPLDIKAQEKLLNFRNLDVDDELTLKANSFIYDLRRAINEKYADNYIMQAVLNQKIVRWGQMPVTYYFETTDKELPDYFSVWILPYDPFGDNRMIYTVKNMVVENPSLVYNEGVTRVFLYTEGELGGTEEIHSVVSRIKGDEEAGERYMTLEDVIDYEKEESYNTGREEGSVLGFISACREFGKTDEEIINLLIEKFSLTKEEAIAKLSNN